MVSYLEMKKEYCSSSWESADKEEEEEGEGGEETNSADDAGAGAGAAVNKGMRVGMTTSRK